MTWKLAMIRNAENLNVAYEYDKVEFIRMLTNLVEVAVNDGMPLRDAMFKAFAKMLKDMEDRKILTP